MLTIHCAGTHYEMGFQHGSQAKAAIDRSLAFYETKFRQTCRLEWPQVQELALQYADNIRKQWPDFLEEMQGLASGSSHPLSSILALNIRTELAFGLFSDGCTALSWLTATSSFLAQNWDWEPAQSPNLIHLTLAPPSPKPRISMITEAGIIGKIGLNSSGVGVCLNAIRAPGVDCTRIPCHLGLRLVLEAPTLDQAIQNLRKTGVASSCHMLIADATGAKGVEWSSVDGRVLEMDGRGRVVHTNHFVVGHWDEKGREVLDGGLLRGDTRRREGRMWELVDVVEGEPGWEMVRGLFRDQRDAPAAICRGVGDGEVATLFNIVMDLKKRRAEVLVGRPSEPEERLVLEFRE